MRCCRFILGRIVAVALLTTIPGSRAAGQAATRATVQDPTPQRTFAVPHVLDQLDKAIAQSAPKGLSAADQKLWEQQTEWVRSVRVRVEAFGVQAGVLAPRDAASGLATGRRTHDPVTIQKDLEALQRAIQQEARRFSMLSNVMKARHDTVKNMISNMKA